jgi:hypothetical protein
VYNPERQLGDHQQPVRYEMRLPMRLAHEKVNPRGLYILPPEPTKPVPAPV